MAPVTGSPLGSEASLTAACWTTSSSSEVIFSSGVPLPPHDGPIDIRVLAERLGSFLAQFYDDKPVPRLILLVRSTVEPLQMVQPVKDIVRSLDPNMPMLETRTYEDLYRYGTVEGPRVAVLLAGEDGEFYRKSGIFVERFIDGPEFTVLVVSDQLARRMFRMVQVINRQHIDSLPWRAEPTPRRRSPTR